MHVHAFFAPTGFAIDPADSFYKEGTVFSKTTSEHSCLPMRFASLFNPLLLTVLIILQAIKSDCISITLDCFWFSNAKMWIVLAVLNTYLPRPKNKTGVNLLATTQAEQEKARVTDKEEAAKPAEYINFIKPYISISLIDDATSYPANAVPDHVRFYLPSCKYMHLIMTCLLWSVRDVAGCSLRLLVFFNSSSS